MKKRLFGTICTLVALLVLGACAGKPSTTPSPEAAWPGSTTLPSGYRLEKVPPLESPGQSMNQLMDWSKLSAQEMADKTTFIVQGDVESCHLYDLYRTPTSAMPFETLCIVELKITDILYAQEEITHTVGDIIRFQIMAEAYDEYMVPYFTSEFLAPQIADGSLFFLRQTQNALDEEGNIQGVPYTELSEYTLFHNELGVWRPIENGYSVCQVWGWDMEEKLKNGRFGQQGVTSITTEGELPYYIRHVTPDHLKDYFLGFK
nr:hypothetical protein [bacterium]